MLAQGGGAIVNMSSTAGLPRSARDGRLRGGQARRHRRDEEAPALDYAAKGIRINAVLRAPSWNDRIASLPPERREPIVRAVPLGHIGRRRTWPAAVVWLARTRRHS